ncbi:MAG: element excision factor XisH family protein [Anaerolineae bacterium]
MPTLDQCHDNVVHALQKDGWTVQPLPLYLTLKRRRAFIDIQASRQENGSANSIIVAEVKCLTDTESLTTDIYTAIGQYLIYRTLLRQKQFSMPIYLVVPEEIHTNSFDETVRLTMNESKIKLLVVNIATETIVRWIE